MAVAVTSDLTLLPQQTNGSVVEHVHMNSDPNETASEVVGKLTKSNQKLEANGMML